MRSIATLAVLGLTAGLSASAALAQANGDLDIDKARAALKSEAASAIGPAFLPDQKFLAEPKAASAASLDDLKAASAPKSAGQGAEWAKFAEPAKAGYAEFKATAAKAMPTEALPFEALSGAKSNRDPAIGKPAGNSLR